jgi:hypothetical protein
MNNFRRSFAMVAVKRFAYLNAEAERPQLVLAILLVLVVLLLLLARTLVR